jgi:hypothetical protein
MTVYFTTWLGNGVQEGFKTSARGTGCGKMKQDLGSLGSTDQNLLWNGNESPQKTKPILTRCDYSYWDIPLFWKALTFKRIAVKDRVCWGKKWKCFSQQRVAPQKVLGVNKKVLRNNFKFYWVFTLYQSWFKALMHYYYWLIWSS